MRSSVAHKSSVFQIIHVGGHAARMRRHGATARLLLSLAPLALGHPRPRPFTPLNPPTPKDFHCPVGPYLDGRPDRTGRLQRHVRQAFARGMQSSQLDAPMRGSLNTSLFYTHESAAWPKPAQCQARRAQTCRLNPHFCIILPQGNSPRTSLVSERHRIAFRQVWKVASSSLASFFYCNMWGDLRAEKLLPGQQPHDSSNEEGRRVRAVFPAREPISRFVASSFEVLERLLNHVSPSGQRMPDDMYVEPSGPLSQSVLERSTSWYGPLQRLINNPNRSATEHNAMVYALVDGFLFDIECGIVYSAAEHLATQMSFITSGYAVRAVLDFQIRLANVTSDLERLGAAIDYPSARPNSSSVWKCPLGRENDAASKAKLVVSKADFKTALAQHPSLVQRLCTVYIQDFLCLGFPMPPECEGGRELEWAGTGTGSKVQSAGGSGTGGKGQGGVGLGGRGRHAGTFGTAGGGALSRAHD